MVATKTINTAIRETLEAQGWLKESSDSEVAKLNSRGIERINGLMMNLLSHNTEKHFYLPRKGKIKDDMVACLDNSVSFRVKNIYEAVLKSRVATMNASYRHKLANKMGNLYNRVGLPEYQEVTGMNDQDFSNFIPYKVAEAGLSSN